MEHNGDTANKTRMVVGGVLLLLCAALLVLSVFLVPSASTTQTYQATGRAQWTVDAPMPNGYVDINEADLDELTALHGIGETLAQSILDAREAWGAFYYPEDLLSVEGIGEKKLAGFRDALDFSGE